MIDNPFDNAEDIKLTQAEYRLQLAVVEHINRSFPGLFHFHIPNRPGSAKDGFMKKQMGARSGAPDLLFFWRETTLKAGAIELKAPGGKLAAPQNKFLSAIHHLGVRTAVCNSVKQVHDTLLAWGLKSVSNSIKEPDYRADMQKKSDAFDFFKPE